MIFVKIIFLAALLRLLVITNRPWMCAGIYTGALAVFGIFSFFNGTAPFLAVLLALIIASAIRFALSGFYFWLLNRIDSGVWWWIVMAAGILIGLV